MKKLTCADLGGPITCNFEVCGNTFMEMGGNCKAHVMAQMQAGDKDHQDAATAMMQMAPDAQQKAMAEYEQKFNNAPEV